MGLIVERVQLPLQAVGSGIRRPPRIEDLEGKRPPSLGDLRVQGLMHLLHPFEDPSERHPGVFSHGVNFTSASRFTFGSLLAVN